jgi:hypothetical protein
VNRTPLIVRTTFLLILLVSLSLNVLGEVPGNKPPIKDQIQRTEQKTNAPIFDTSSLEKTIREAIKDATEKPDPNAQEKLESDRRLVQYTEQLADFTKWLVIATGILAVIAIWQGVQLRNTVGAMKNDFNATHRPKIRVRNISIQGELWAGQQIGVTTDIVNTGVTRAKITNYSAKILILPIYAHLPPGPEYDRMMLVRHEPFLEPGRATSLPPMDEQLVDISDTDNADIREGRKTLYGFGFVIYEDPAGRPRQTAFCRVLVPPSGGSQNGHFVRLDPEREAYEYED